jgi:uncharacterized membrane protein (DUF4010 family)
MMAMDLIEALPDPEFLLRQYPNVSKLLFAAALGLLVGVEREWAQKLVGVRTFTLVATLGTVMTILDDRILVALGALLVVLQGTVLAVNGIGGDDDLHLTTSIAMLLVYGIGVTVGTGLYFEGVVLGILATFLLLQRRELHAFAGNRSKEELRSGVQLGVLAFVVYPLLPTEPIDPWGAVYPRVVWLLVVAVGAIGFCNYLIVSRYGTRGVAVTSFFGGLVNSTAVVGEIASRTRENRSMSTFAVGVVLLADAAMAFRDLVIVALFAPALVRHVGPPLAAMTLAGVVLSYLLSDWDAELDVEFTSPFDLQSVLKFGGLFLAVLLLSAFAQHAYGPSGFVVTSFFSGLVSSGAVTTTAVLLANGGGISAATATAGIVTGVTASVAVKLLLVASMDRALLPRAAAGSALVVLAAVVAVAVTPFVT